jgi:hypothetical protein
MSVTWTISHPSRLVVAIARDEIHTSDVEGYLSALSLEGAMPYRQLFDITDVHKPLSLPDIRQITRKARAYAKAGPVGPLAIVVASDLVLNRSKVFGDVSRTHGKLGVFRELHDARAWLDTLATDSERK